MEILVFSLSNENSILGRLRARFPSIGFRKCDLSMELGEEGRDLIVLETVPGFGRVTLIEDVRTMGVGRALEGSGSLMTLRILLRIGSIDSARVIAVPENYPEQDAVKEIIPLIESLS